MNQFAKTLVAGAVLAATGAAHAEISGNVALATDYVWRGFSQTDNQMAISGGLDYAHESGFYLGTWGSNVNFGPGDPSMEIDVYAGFAGEMGAIGYDIGVARYMYPSADDLNFNEFYVGGSYGFTDAISANAKYYYSDDFGGSGDSAWRIEGGLALALPADFGLSLTVGQNDGDYFDDGTDYVDYAVGLTKSMWDLDFGLTYTDSDADDCGNICDGRVVFSVGKSL